MASSSSASWTQVVDFLCRSYFDHLTISIGLRRMTALVTLRDCTTAVNVVLESNAVALSAEITIEYMTDERGVK